MRFGFLVLWACVPVVRNRRKVCTYACSAKRRRFGTNERRGDGGGGGGREFKCGVDASQSSHTRPWIDLPIPLVHRSCGALIYMCPSVCWIHEPLPQPSQATAPVFFPSGLSTRRRGQRHPSDPCTRRRRDLDTRARRHARRSTHTPAAMARVFVAGLYLASLFLSGFAGEDYYKILVRPVCGHRVWVGVRVGWHVRCRSFDSIDRSIKRALSPSPPVPIQAHTH